MKHCSDRIGWLRASVLGANDGILSVASLVQLCRTTKSQEVLMAIASALPRLAPTSRLNVARELFARMDSSGDKYLELMTWYGSADFADPPQLLSLIRSVEATPRLTRFAARRLMQLKTRHNSVAALLTEATDERLRAILEGMLEGISGQLNPAIPNGWEELSHVLMASRSAEVRRMTQQLSAAYGDTNALEALRAL